MRFSSLLMICCLVVVKLWFLMCVWKCLLLLNRLLMMKNMRFGLNMNSDVLCSGFMCIRFRLVGIGRLWVNLLYFCIFIWLMEIFVVCCMKLKMLICNRCVKWLLMILRLGIWLWMICFCVVML